VQDAAALNHQNTRSQPPPKKPPEHTTTTHQLRLCRPQVLLPPRQRRHRDQAAARLGGVTSVRHPGVGVARQLLQLLDSFPLQISVLVGCEGRFGGHETQWWSWNTRRQRLSTQPQRRPASPFPPPQNKRGPAPLAHLWQQPHLPQPRRLLPQLPRLDQLAHRLAYRAAAPQRQVGAQLLHALGAGGGGAELALQELDGLWGGG